MVSVEISAELHQLAQEELIDCDNVTLLRRDALKNKNRLNPDMLEAVAKHLAVDPCRRLKLVANLPYNIATPVISNLLSTDITPYSMTVTIQKELADRITARPRTKDYSALSVWIQSQCEAEVMRILPPTVFWPRPKVHSAIMHIVPQPEKRAGFPSRNSFTRSCGRFSCTVGSSSAVAWWARTSSSWARKGSTTCWLKWSSAPRRGPRNWMSTGCSRCVNASGRAGPGRW